MMKTTLVALGALVAVSMTPVAYAGQNGGWNSGDCTSSDCNITITHKNIDINKNIDVNVNVDATVNARFVDVPDDYGDATATSSAAASTSGTTGTSAAASNSASATGTDGTSSAGTANTSSAGATNGGASSSATAGGTSATVN